MTEENPLQIDRDATIRAGEILDFLAETTATESGDDPVPTPTPEPTPEPTSNSPGNPGIITAPPGEVQSVLNEVTSEGGYDQPIALVSLRPNTVYRPTETWELPKHTVLDCYGATIKPQTDAPVFDYRPTSVVRGSHVNVRESGGYTAAVHRVAPDDHGDRWWQHDPYRRFNIVDGFVQAAGNPKATGVEVRTDEMEVYFLGVDLSMHYGGVVLDLIRDGDESAGFINGNIAYLSGIKQKTAVVRQQHNGNCARSTINGNRWYIDAQPHDTEWIWDIQQGARNIMSAHPYLWDWQRCVDGTAVRITDPYDSDIPTHRGNSYNALEFWTLDGFGTERWEVADRYDTVNGVLATEDIMTPFSAYS